MGVSSAFCTNESARRSRSVALALFLGLVGAMASAVLAEAQPTEEPGAVVLMYHRFGEDNTPSTSIRLAQFEAHLAELRQPQYTVLPIPEILAALREGQPLPSYTVGITIDDAYASVYHEAWPRLRDAGFPFTLFVSTEAVDRGYRDMLSWAQLREMVRSGGVTIGNHTVSHLHMPDHDIARNRLELDEATRRIAAEAGITPVLFAYPYGEASQRVMKTVAAAGFSVAFGQHSGVLSRGGDPLYLPRFALNEHYGDMERFRLVAGALPLPVTGLTPRDPLVTPEDNPPHLGITVADGVGRLARLTCYVSGQGRLELRREGPRGFAGRPARPFPPGRTRINCTVPGPDGRWRWLGMQFFVSGAP